MLTDLQISLLNTFALVSYYGLIYFGVLGLVYSADSKSYTRITTEITNSPNHEPLSTVSEPVLQADIANSEAVSETLAVTEQTAEPSSSEQESTVDLSSLNGSISIVEYDDTPIPYRHELWPSPRPVNFVHAIMEHEPDFKPRNRRIAHVNAVDILAERAYMTRKEFLKTNPLIYSEKYMKGMNALYLLKDSIDHLESMLRNEVYRQELRRIENGKITCSY